MPTSVLDKMTADAVAAPKELAALVSRLAEGEVIRPEILPMRMEPKDRIYRLLRARFATEARGRHKTTAKRLAATKMMKHIRATPGRRNYALPEEVDDDEIISTLEHWNKLSRDAQREGRAHFDEFLHVKRDLPSPDSKLGQLLQWREEEMQIDPVQKVGDLGKELEVSMVFVDVEENSTDGKIQSLLQIGFDPLVVSFGFGVDYESSKKECAYQALQMLKVMFKT